MQSSGFSVFDGLTNEDVAQILKDLPRRQFSNGATLFAQGDNGREIYVVQTGTADVFMQDHDGREHRINQIGPGATLGEVSLFTRQPISATVRATSDLEVVALSEADFYRSASSYPRLFQNVGAILSQRLVLANRSSLRDTGPRVTLLRDFGAPPMLGYALACSVAWHTRASTLLLLVSETAPSAELSQLAGLRLQPASEGRALPSTGSHVHVLAANPGSALGKAALKGGAGPLCDSYDHVLVQIDAATAPEWTGRTLRLADRSTSLPNDSELGPGSTLRAWAGADVHAPTAGDIEWNVPSLDEKDAEGLRSGILPLSTAAGRLLGKAARAISGLKVGLALGAGAEKGYAHVGVLQVLERAGVPVDCITGTSIGSGMAAMYASGHSPEEMLSITDHLGASSFHLALPKSGLLSSSGIREGLKSVVGDKRFSDLLMPLAVVAADLVSQREIVFDRGFVWSAVLASMAIPGMYPPQRMGAYTLVDGGVLNPVPSDIVVKLGADVVIAVSLSTRAWLQPEYVEAVGVAGRSPSMLQAALGSIDLMQNKISAGTTPSATVFLEPLRDTTLTRAGLRHFSAGRAYVALGVTAAEEALPQIAAALPWLRG